MFHHRGGTTISWGAGSVISLVSTMLKVNILVSGPVKLYFTNIAFADYMVIDFNGNHYDSRKINIDIEVALLASFADDDADDTDDARQ